MIFVTQSSSNSFRLKLMRKKRGRKKRRKIRSWILKMR